MDYPSEAEILDQLPSVEELVLELIGSQDVSSETLGQAIRKCEDESITLNEQGVGYDSIFYLAKRTKLQAYLDQSAAPMDRDVANDSDTTLPQTDDILPQTDVLSQTKDISALPQAETTAESSGALLRRLTDEKEAWQKQLSEMKETLEAQDTKMEEDKRKRREKIDEMVHKTRDAGMIVPVMKAPSRVAATPSIPPKAATITGTQENTQPTAATIPTVTGRTRTVWAANSGFHTRRARAVAKTMPAITQGLFNAQQRCIAAPSYTGGAVTRYRGDSSSFSGNTQQFMADGNTQQFMVDSMGRWTVAPRKTSLSGYSTPMPGGSALYAVGTPSATAARTLMSSQRNVSALPVAPSNPPTGGVSLMSSQRNISLMSSQQNVPLMSTQQNVPLMSTQQNVPRVSLMSSQQNMPLMSGAMTPMPGGIGSSTRYMAPTSGTATYAPTNGYPRSCPSAPVVTQAMPMTATTINIGGAYRAA